MDLCDLGFGIRKRAALLARFILPTVSCVLLFAGCAVKQVSLPSYEGVAVEEALAELREVSSIEAVLSVQYERGDTMMSGDAALTLSSSRLSLKVFYLGFLAAELTEENGTVRSRPQLDRVKSTMLVEGLKCGFLWWSIRDYTVEETGEHYIITNADRELMLDKRTLLPSHQVLTLRNGEHLAISYASPARAEVGGAENGNGKPSPHSVASRFRVLTSGFWYPSEMTIAFRNQAARVRVTSYTVLD